MHGAVLLAFYSPMLDSCDIQMFTLFIETRWWERTSLEWFSDSTILVDKNQPFFNLDVRARYGIKK